MQPTQICSSSYGEGFIFLYMNWCFLEATCAHFLFSCCHASSWRQYLHLLYNNFFRYWKTVISSPLNFPFKKPNPSTFLLMSIFQSSKDLAGALLDSLHYFCSVSLDHWGDQNWTQDYRYGLTSADMVNIKIASNSSSEHIRNSTRINALLFFNIILFFKTWRLRWQLIRKSRSIWKQQPDKNSHLYHHFSTIVVLYFLSINSTKRKKEWKVLFPVNEITLV